MIARLFLHRLCGWILLAAGVPFGVLSWAEQPAPPGFQESAYIRQMVSAFPQGFFSALTLPTESEPVARQATDWDRAAALLVNLPLGELLEDEGLLEFYREMLAVAALYVPVLAGYDNEEARHLIRVEEALFSDPRLAEAKDRIEFVESRSRSKWVRDYGPIFLVGASGALLVADPIYGELKREIRDFTESPMQRSQQSLSGELDQYIQLRKFERKNDTVPLVLMKHLRQDLKLECDIVRPPILLLGGNFLTDGQGTIFVSEDTVMANGGRRRVTQDVVKAYFGAEEVHILDSLPEPAPSRIDVLLRFARPDLIFLSEPPEIGPESSSFSRYLARQARRVFESNKAYLERRLPGVEVISLPTLPLNDNMSERFVSDVRNDLLKSLCAKLGINYVSYRSLSEDSQDFKTATRMINKHLSEELDREIDLSRIEDLDASVQKLLGMSLEIIVQTYRNWDLSYRSYVSSIFVNPGDGRMAVMVPRYRALESDGLERIAEAEARVEEAYRHAYPGVKIHWIQVDSVISGRGTLRSLSMIVPDVRDE